MRARNSGAVALLIAGLLTLSPLVGTSALADDTPPPATSPTADATPAPTPSATPAPTQRHVVISRPDAGIASKTTAVIHVHTSSAGLPDSVGSLQMTATPTSLMANWSTPNNGGSPLLRYDATLLDDSLQTITTQTLDPSATSVLFTGLTEVTSYYIRVSAVTAVGSADSIQNWHTSAYSPDAVTNVQGTPDTTSIVVTWNPTTYDGGSPIIWYDVQATNVATGEVTSININAPALTATLSGLTPGTAYLLSVGASNGYHEPFSAPTTVSTSPVSPDQPTNVQLSQTDPTTAHVTWDAPASSGGSPVTTYEWRVYLQADSSTIASGTVADSTTSVDFPSLTYGLTYVATVTATNAVGTGPAGSTDPFVRSQLPGDPAHVTGSGVANDDGTATISTGWDASAGATSYAAELKGSDGTDTLETPSTNSQSFTVSYDPTVTYTISVMAFGDNGQSNPVTSGRFEVTPPPPVAQVPATPTIDTGTAVGYHDPGVSITWQNSSDGGSPITGYVVNLFDTSGALVWIDNVSPDSRSYNFTHLPTGTSYTATLTAINVVGSSAPSAGFAVATNPLDPMAPLLQTVENGGNSGMSLTVSGDTAVAHINSDTTGARTEGGVPSVWVYGIVYSTASSLGWVQINTDGNATWTLPTLAAGLHHLAVLNDAGDIIATASFRVAGATSGTGSTGDTAQTTGLAFTGTDPGSPLALAVFALVSGIALVALNRRRRMLARR